MNVLRKLSNIISFFPRKPAEARRRFSALTSPNPTRAILPYRRQCGSNSRRNNMKTIIPIICLLNANALSDDAVCRARAAMAVKSIRAKR
jgi:hypothetical protein